MVRLENNTEGREHGYEKQVPIIIIAISCMHCRCHGLIRQGFCGNAFIFMFSCEKPSPFIRAETQSLEGMMYLCAVWVKSISAMFFFSLLRLIRMDFFYDLWKFATLRRYILYVLELIASLNWPCFQLLSINLD